MPARDERHGALAAPPAATKATYSAEGRYLIATGKSGRSDPRAKWCDVARPQKSNTRDVAFSSPSNRPIEW